MSVWQPVSSAPKDGTRCLFYSPGNPKAWNENARDARMSVDSRSERWPSFHFQYPEAPYTHWMPLPAHPKEGETQP